MSDLVKRLRSIDQMSVEDCFLQSYLYTKAADRIEELEANLAKVTAERDAAYKSVDANWITHQEVIASRERAEAAEAMLPRAYRAGVEAAEKFVGSHVYTTNGGTVSMEPVSPKFVGMDQHHATVARAIRALPTPKPAELLTMCAEKENPDE